MVLPGFFFPVQDHFNNRNGTLTSKFDTNLYPPLALPGFEWKEPCPPIDAAEVSEASGLRWIAHGLVSISPPVPAPTKMSMGGESWLKSVNSMSRENCVFLAQDEQDQLDKYFLEDESEDSDYEEETGKDSRQRAKEDEELNLVMEDEKQYLSMDAIICNDIGDFATKFMDLKTVNKTDSAILERLLNDKSFVKTLGYSSIFNNDHMMESLGIDEKAFDGMGRDSTGKEVKKGKGKGGYSERSKVPNQHNWYTSEEGSKHQVHKEENYVHDINPPSGNKPEGWKEGVDDVPVVTVDALESKTRVSCCRRTL